MMRLETFYQLLGTDGQQLLAEYGQEPVTRENHLQLASRLREVASSELASAVLETLILRQKAAAKFERAGSMYFTRDALEQASSEIVSRYRASRYHEAGFTKIADLGCGIGGDALSLCQGAEVTGVEWNPLRLAMAQENVRIYGLSERFHPLQADLLELSPLEVPALFADPGRRDEYGGRIYSVHDYRPPLSSFEGWLDAVPHQGIKIGPGVDYAELPTGIEIEFVSVRGEVREGVLWRGDLRTEAGRRATLLPGGATLTDFPVGSVEVAEPKEYLYEPDGAVIRAHLVEQLAHGLNATKIDDNIVIKVPMTIDGIKATRTLASEEIKTNVTLVFSPLQALMAAKAGATFVSPFVGRLDDLAQEGMVLVDQIVEIYGNYG
ncbi:MAG: transaldolase family protein, partial [Candidatus Promineifilaceae bacterium]